MRIQTIDIKRATVAAADVKNLHLNATSALFDDKRRATAFFVAARGRQTFTDC